MFKGNVIHDQLASRVRPSGPWPHAVLDTRLRPGRPCPPWWIPTKLKYLFITVMTATITMLEKSVHFPEHVSPGYCAGIPVRVNLSISSFLYHIKIYVYSWFFVFTQSLLNVRLACTVRQIDRLTDRQTDRQNCQLQ